MSRPRGKPVDEEVQKAVEAAIRHLKIANVSLVQLEVKRLLNRKVSWGTIFKDLEKLRDEHKIHKQIMAQFSNKKAYVYISE